MIGWNPEDIRQSDTEFLILIKGYDDTFNQTIYTRSSYRHNELIWGARFDVMYDNEEEGITTLHLELIDKIQKVDLPDTEGVELAKTENTSKS
jgi:inward rectifier potassium channel